MTNQQGAPEALPPAFIHYPPKKPELARVDFLPMATREERGNGWVTAALVEAQQPAAHVQNPAEIEHVAGDVSKNGPGSNMAQQPAPSAAAIRALDAYNSDTRDADPGSPLERLRFFCSLAMNGQDWLDAEQFFNELAAQPSPTPQADSAPADPDGEAFRTAARLGLTLRFYGGCAQSSMPGTPSAYEVVTGQDRATAMREAVERAEAVIAAGGKPLLAPLLTPQADSQPAAVREVEQAFVATMREIYGNEFPTEGAFAGDHGWSDHWAIFQAGTALRAARAQADSGVAPAGGAVAGMPPGISALMCVISSLRDTAHFSDEEGEVTDDLRTLRDWALAQAGAPQPSPTPQADSQPVVDSAAGRYRDECTQGGRCLGGCLNSEPCYLKVRAQTCSVPTPTHAQIAAYLEATGAYVTNDSTREAAIAEAISADRAARATADRVTAPAYSIDADPQGIRARVADAITGALAFGAQGANPPPTGHWLVPFWETAREEASRNRPVSSDTLYLLRRLLSNQHTLTGSEFREELTKIVGEAAQAADSVLEDAASTGFFLQLPQRPKPEAPAGTVGLDWDAYSGAQMLAYGRDCSNAAIVATQKPEGA